MGFSQVDESLKSMSLIYQHSDAEHLLTITIVVYSRHSYPVVGMQLKRILITSSAGNTHEWQHHSRTISLLTCFLQ